MTLDVLEVRVLLFLLAVCIVFYLYSYSVLCSLFFVDDGVVVGAGGTVGGAILSAIVGAVTGIVGATAVVVVCGVSSIVGSVTQ